MQNQLKEIALLGTTKKGLDVELLKPSVKEIISKATFEDVEHKLLNTLSAVHYYMDAGTIYPVLDEVPEMPIITDSGTYAPVKAQEIFSLLNTMAAFIRPLLLDDLLNVLLEKKWLVAPENCLGLLQFANQYSVKVKDKVLQVIGNKGRYIVLFDSSLKYTVSTNINTDVWEYGTTKERTEFIEKLRKTDTEKSIEFLQNSWKSETVVVKRNWLQIISNTYNSKSDLEFISEVYTTGFKFKEKELKTNVECRKILAQMLLGDRYSQLFKETTTVIETLFVTDKKKGFLGMGSTLKTSLMLPAEDAENPFWNATHLSNVYGFDAAYDIAIFKNSTLYYFSLFLTYMPRTFWTPFFQDSVDDFTTYFLTNDAFKVKRANTNLPIFTLPLVENTIQNKDEVLANSLAGKLKVTEALRILPLFNQADYEKFILKNKLLGDTEVLEYHPENNTEWNLKFCESLIIEFSDNCAKYYYNQFNTCAMVLAKKAPVEILKILESQCEKVSHSNNYNQWNTHFYEPLSTYLKIKITLKNL
ncbi:hypothetical protein EV196_107129 [Mariniflexile fucanivorans]|uniref:Uncharacterized protein n=1 Tax=Mariniflexile fucanivorans TaxID=264023 RepID=A0A4R1RFR2_9FLAO|nr:DUF5691 domain-containing protein [Mariniflexile fucanivorans]TCL64422.1 hypothetical protein EV196_107129 [Mariniflexile fucanivorans]